MPKHKTSTVPSPALRKLVDGILTQPVYVPPLRTISGMRFGYMRGGGADGQVHTGGLQRADGRDGRS